MGLFGDYLEDIGRRLALAGAEPLLGGWGASLDQLADDARQAAAYGRPDECPSEATALDYLARSRGLWRLHGEPVEAARTLARTAFEVHQTRGTTAGIVAQLARLGYTARLTSQAELYDRFGGSPFGGYTGFFFVEIIDGGWTAPTTWNGGAAWNGAGATWDVPEPYQGAVGDVLAVVRRWKADGTSCRYVRLSTGRAWVTVPCGEAWEGGSGPYLQSYLTP